MLGQHLRQSNSYVVCNKNTTSLKIPWVAQNSGDILRKVELLFPAAGREQNYGDFLDKTDSVQ